MASIPISTVFSCLCVQPLLLGKNKVGLRENDLESGGTGKVHILHAAGARWALSHGRQPAEERVASSIIHSSCVLCSAAPETCLHLFHRCSYTVQVWALVRQWIAFPFEIPSTQDVSLESWWCPVRKGFAQKKIPESF